MTKNAENGPTWNLVSMTPNFIVKNLQVSIVGLWGFEITDADGYLLAFFCLRNK